MKIKTKQSVPLETIPYGGTFVWDDEYLLLTRESKYIDGETRLVVVNIQTGTCKYLSSTEQVTTVNLEAEEL